MATEFFLTELTEEMPAGKPPIPVGVVKAPGGGDLRRPPMATSCLWTAGLRADSALFLCFALAISAIQTGCCIGVGVILGFGDSGLFKALSSQLALVGLHLRFSAFEGL